MSIGKSLYLKTPYGKYQWVFSHSKNEPLVLDNWQIYGYNVVSWHFKCAVSMIIKTRIFELCNGNYKNLSELAQAMGLSVSQVYRVREGKRSINQKFIIGAKRAFADYTLDELFYLDSEEPSGNGAETFVTSRYQYIVQQCTTPGLLDT